VHSNNGPARDFVGYGKDVPVVAWPNDAKVAINLVINYEEGSEYSYDVDGFNDNQVEVSYNFPSDKRDLAQESMYEYGSRAGIWRLFRVLDELDVPCTMYACSRAFELNPEVARHARERGYDLLSHGRRWEEVWRYDRDGEQAAMSAAVSSFQETWGAAPDGWYCRYGASVNTRELVVENGGFLYDSDAYNDDLPYWTKVLGKDHLVIPYSLTYNDMQGSKSPQSFLDYAVRGLDELWHEGNRGTPRMMSVGLHPRLIGQAGRANALREFISYAQAKGDVWFARRVEIANHWIRNVPPPGSSQ
jgi:peptidoglycan/xylan/chitin deacetylase (PgdA/CDA1 family)